MFWFSDDPGTCHHVKDVNQSFQTHLKEFIPMAAEQSVGLGLILAVQSIHSKLILLHTRLTSYNTDDNKKYADISVCFAKHYE